MRKLSIAFMTLIGMNALLSAADPSSLPALKGELSPSPSSDQPFTTQPSGLPAAEQETAGQAPTLIGPEKVWALPQLIDEALRRNPATQQAWYTARASEADLGVARSAYYPTVTLSATGGVQHVTSPTYPGNLEVNELVGAPQLQLQYLLLDFGGRSAGVEAARYTLLTRNHEFNQALQTVVLNVMTNYYNLDYTRANVENAETSLTLAQSNLDSVNIRSKAGLASLTDVYQAKQTVAQDQYNLENAKGALNQAQVQLLTSVGMPGNSHINVAPPKERPSVKILSQEVDKVVDAALRRRPDLAAKYATWRAQLATASQAEANRWPTLTTGVTLEREFYTGRIDPGSGPSSNIDGHNDTAAALLTFSFDVFDGGNKLNQARSAKRQAEAARAALSQAELGAIADVVVNFIAFKTASKSVEAAEALIAASQQSYDSVSASYKSGLKSILDLLTAQNNLASAKTTLAQAQSNLYIAAANLANATGDILPSPLASNGETPSTNPDRNVAPATENR